MNEETRSQPSINDGSHNRETNHQINIDDDDLNDEHNRHRVRVHRYYPIDKASTPPGVSFLGAFFRFNSISSKRTFHKTLVFCVTFIAYICYHMGRRPLSIVKNVLNRNCSDVDHVILYDESENVIFFEYEPPTTSHHQDPNWCDWAPFNDDATANRLLAILDSAFLFSYAFFMFFSGFVAERCNLRYFLSAGMILSGILLYIFGMAFYFNIHSMKFFILVQVLSGAVQTTGFPSVVTCVGNWFDHSSRGSIFGLWNSNSNFGNILGAMVAGYFVERSWGLSFLVPGFIMFGCGILVFLFLVPRPEDVHLLPMKSLKSTKTATSAGNNSLDDSYHRRTIEQAIDSISHMNTATNTTTTSIVYCGSDDETTQRTNHRRKSPKRDETPTRTTDDAYGGENCEPPQYNSNSEHSPLISSTPSVEMETEPLHAVSFATCLAIPGVLEYSLSLGFAKLVGYTFLYWLPRYIRQSTVNNSEESAYLSVPFDIGGMIGAIIAGYLCDKYKKSATTCLAMLVCAIPSVLIFERFASISNLYNISLQIVTGALVYGPCALITTAVSADLGSRIKNGKSMATVTAIIDGTGSIGAAIGPLVAGYVSDSGWQSVFLMLMVSELIASLCLIRMSLREIGLR